jgi:hypothetical protein
MYSLNANTTASHNTAMGYNALGLNTTGASNVAIGNYALDANLTSASSTAVGYQALTLNTAAGNTGIGNNALAANVGGGTNTAIGSLAGNLCQTGINNSMIGSNAQAAATDTVNSVTLGNSAISSLRCQVQTISALSDRRDKKNIADLPVGLDFINTLRPVKFTWDMRDGVKVDIEEVGFIAQDLDEAQQEFDAEEYLQLVLKENPDKLEASYGKLVPMLVKAVQELSAKNEALEDRIKSLEG